MESQIKFNNLYLNVCDDQFNSSVQLCKDPIEVLARKKKQNKIKLAKNRTKTNPRIKLDLRVLIVRLKTLKKTNKQVALEVGCSQRSVTRIYNNFLKTNSISFKKIPGRTKKVSDDKIMVSSKLFNLIIIFIKNFNLVKVFITFYFKRMP